MPESPAPLSAAAKLLPTREQRAYQRGVKAEFERAAPFIDALNVEIAALRTERDQLREALAEKRAWLSQAEAIWPSAIAGMLDHHGDECRGCEIARSALQHAGWERARDPGRMHEWWHMRAATKPESVLARETKGEQVAAHKESTGE